MSEYVFITVMVYISYFVFLAIFGILIGFSFGIYKRNKEIHIFTLLFLLQILYNNILNPILLKSNKAKHFSKLSLKTVQQINSGSLKIILKEPSILSQIILPILNDPLVWIEFNLISKEFINYEFELFRWYPDLNDKLKY
jgi:hypothetical protein